MSKGKTFKVGKLLVNISERGIATKNPETDEIRRYPFPWAKAPQQNPAPQADDQYEEEYNNPDEYASPDYDEPEYEQDGEYQEDDDYDQNPGLLDSAWLMWAALIVLPPLGIWLLWRSKRFNITWNTIISSLSAIWFLLLLILLFTRMNGNNEDINQPPIVTPTPTIEASATPTPSPTPDPTAIPENTATPTPSPTPEATPQTGNTGVDPQQSTEPTASAEPTYVWSKEGGTWYHADSTCGGMKDATRVSLAVALNRRQTACPDCMPTTQETKPTATPIPEGYFYSTPTGTWYHIQPNCQNMTAAQVVSLADALARNQTACPTCIGSVYMTDGGTWYHSVSNCQNMTGAYLTTIEKAIEAGKTACDKCMNGTSTGNTGTTTTGSNTGTGSDIFYYNPNGGTYYHKTENCSGMKNAVKGTAAAAENNGMKPCPTCLGGTSANAKFYATTNGQWYHTKSNCQGMTNAVRITEATAIARGKTACPECAGGVATGGTTVHVNTGNTTTNNNNVVAAQATKLYSTVDGENFHSKQDCRGMKGATEVDAEEIAKREQTPCPRCIGTSGTYYSTLNGDYYHSKADCTGMKDADIVTLAMINARKQDPCPRCIGGTNGKTYYWATATGAYYHSKSTCSGMKGAVKVTEDEAEDRDQLPCPTCVGSVWGTEDGDYYHKNKTCSGMKNAQHLTIQAAEKSGKTACPKCITNTTPTPKPTATPKPGDDDNDSSLYYYATNDGNYYHRESDCTGMKGAKKVSEKDAVARGQKPCPECIGSVWATEGGDHYHATATCSGMKGASLVTVDTAELRGQSPCPECLSDGDHDAPQTGADVVTDTDKVNVYCTLEGKYYHSEKTCGGMKHAASVTLTWALEHNYKRCTDCNAPAVQ